MSGTANKIITILIGLLCYWMFYHYLYFVPELMEWIEWNGTPWLSLAVGVFVGYRLGTKGWAFSMLPPILFFGPLMVLSVINAPPLLSPLFTYKFPFALLISMLGGFIGERLKFSAG